MKNSHTDGKSYITGSYLAAFEYGSEIWFLPLLALRVASMGFWRGYLQFWQQNSLISSSSLSPACTTQESTFRSFLRQRLHGLAVYFITFNFLSSSFSTSSFRWLLPILLSFSLAFLCIFSKSLDNLITCMKPWRRSNIVLKSEHFILYYTFMLSVLHSLSEF